ncbi:unnamed protein product [Arctia plantaginis]|nr:unnamed protein product [Arctia plantaginis]
MKQSSISGVLQNRAHMATVQLQPTTKCSAGTGVIPVGGRGVESVTARRRPQRAVSTARKRSVAINHP